MGFLYFQAGDQRKSERSELSPGAKKIRVSLPPNQLPMKDCPLCKSPYGYALGDLFACPECGHEWSDEETKEKQPVVKDANGNILENGDSVVVIKDLPVKGAPKPVKAGTKVKNIRLTDGDHNIDCKIDGFGSMALKSEFLRKA
jgi:protein PhnA